MTDGKICTTNGGAILAGKNGIMTYRDLLLRLLLVPNLEAPVKIRAIVDDRGNYYTLKASSVLVHTNEIVAKRNSDD